MVLRSMNNIFSRHGRWLFAIITLVIIVSFVGFLTPGFTSLFLGTGNSGANAAIGSAFGKKITRDDVRNQAERDLLQSRMDESKAVSDYNKALSAFYLAEGTLLKHHGISIL